MNSEANASYDFFMKTFTDLYNECFPLTSERNAKKKSRKPWITKGILTSIKKKNRLYKTYLHNPCNRSSLKYTVFQNKLTSVIRSSKNSTILISFRNVKEI